MSRETMLIVLGVVISLTPFVGLPLSWRSAIIPILGALVVIIGITLRARRLTPPPVSSELA